jgi:RimJ/RimL family protein N-acetyltransferase
MASFNNSAIRWEDHERWFTSVLFDSQCDLLIGEDDKGPVGVLRYERQEKQATVSIYLIPGRLGRGLGAELLRAGSEWIRTYRPEVTRLIAEVQEQNEASKRTFLAAGYEPHFCVYQCEVKSSTGRAAQ